MDLGLSDKVALVAASSKGLGRAVAAALAAEGAHLIMCARTPEPLAEAADAIRAATGVTVVARPTDVAAPAELAALVDEGVRTLGRIDIVVTNAGGPPAGPFESHGRDAWEHAARQTLDSVVELCRLTLPGMKERGWGRILNVTSIAAKQPVDGLILSNTMRAAVTGFARTLANEVAPYGITVNNVLPGYTRTERIDGLAAQLAGKQGTSPQQVIDGMAAAVPMGRLGDPAEFAAAVAFLASERASYITGVSLAVDGGWIRALL
ncbi:SDR family oxidoreductase [Haliangium sp.]|uniref:SDR family oxidoreductase n=1 Tax=Haliangium sp. TaxID=2663208 RepID=UPI003D14B265